MQCLHTMLPYTSAALSPAAHPAELCAHESAIPPSGTRPRFPHFRPDETLGAASYVVLSALGLDFVDDEADIACRACSTEPIRAAAWMRSRRATVGHAVSELRVHGEQGETYAALARTRCGPQAPCNLRFGIITSEKLAAWIRPDRLAIVMVGAMWPRAIDGVPHALAVLAAEGRTLTVFDPAGTGEVERVTSDCLDVARAGPGVWAEVLCVGKPATVPRLRLVRAG